MSENEPEFSTRHKFPDRAFHWLMATCTIVLLGTSLLPIAGMKFDWVPIHWISGMALLVLVLFHLVRVFMVHGIAEMVPVSDDVRETANMVSGSKRKITKPAKYDAFQKAYHWGVACIILVLIGTGVLMLVKIDTVFWSREPAIMTDQSWGIVYVLHGAGSLVLVFMILLHIYFGLLPEHRKLLFAMWKGEGPVHARKGAK